MCGRFAVFDDKEIAEINSILCEINDKYSGKGVSAKIGEVFPTDNAPVLSISGGKPSLSLMGWGFPQYSGKGVIINARAETAAEKKGFAKALAERRCVIPSTGFYEWAHDAKGKAKEKYLFNVGNSPMLYMAAVFQEVDDNKPLRERFVILTREANDSMRGTHDRMPVILHKSELVHWLKDPTFTEFAFKREDMPLTRTAV